MSKHFRGSGVRRGNKLICNKLANKLANSLLKFPYVMMSRNLLPVHGQWLPPSCQLKALNPQAILLPDWIALSVKKLSPQGPGSNG